MQCDICFRAGGKKLPFLCPTDARNRLYEPRIRHAQVLVETDALDSKICSFLSAEPKQVGQKGKAPEASRADISAVLAERDQAEDRTKQIIEHADELRAKIEKAREDLAKRKAAVHRRKSELASATNEVDSRRTKQNEEVEKAIRMTKYKWNQTHSVTASSRAFLCGEAAKLYGLRKVRKHGGVEEHRIGGVSIVDLRSMNSKSALALLNTALT